MALVQCPRCAKEVEGASQFCKRCGFELPELVTAAARNGGQAVGAPAVAQKLPLQSALDGQNSVQLRSSYRWYILALVFFATTINYIDRQVWNVIGPFITDKYHISTKEWGILGSAFAWSYAFGQLFIGGVLDRVGVRIGYPVGLALWSLVAIAHAGAIGLGGAVASVLGLTVGSGFVGFAILRGLLGIAESPNYPAATKTLSEWFPKKERAFGMGWVNAGGNVGALIATLLVGPISQKYGWQWAFIFTGGIGMIWLLFWIPMYRHPAEHPRVSASELAYINSDAPEPSTKIPWAVLLSYKQAWAFALSKFITDAMWWSYMVWFAKFLKDQYGMDVLGIGIPLFTIYLLADVGSVAGGWLSSRMIRNGATVNRARKTALIVSALAVVPVMFANKTGNAWFSVILLGMATAGHQGFSSNQYTLVSDAFPRRAVAGVAGLGGFFGYVGAALWSAASGFIKSDYGYTPLFVAPALGYLVAFAIIQLLMPRLEPALIDRQEPPGFPVQPA